MKKNKPQASFVNIGSSSFLIIFLVLSLVIFAVLSLSSAHNDYTFSRQIASHKADYYEASNTAEGIVDEIDAELSSYARDSRDVRAYQAAVQKALDRTSYRGVTLTCYFEQEELFVSFDVPVSEKQALHVKLKITDYTQSQVYYEIKTWQMLSKNT